MFRFAIAGVLAAVGLGAGLPGVAAADCETMADCAVETAQQRVAETIETVAQIEGNSRELVQRIQDDPEGHVQALMTAGMDRAGEAVADAPGGKAVTCVFQGRWTESTGMATGPVTCARRSYLDAADPRNGVSDGSFSMTLVKRYPITFASHCAFSLRSPAYGTPGAYGTITTPGGTYNVLFDGADAGALGNHAGRVAWWDAEHSRSSSLGAYALNAEPVSILAPRVATDCSGDLFVNGVVTLFVV